MERVIGFLGIFCLIGIAYLFSNNRSKVDKRLIIVAILLQIFTALFILGIPALGVQGPLEPLFKYANDFFVAILDFTAQGSRFLFGSFMDTQKYGFVIALQVLPVIIFMSSLMSILYYLGFMQKVIYFFAWVMHKAMRVSGAESFATSANIFFGQTEAPLMIKPYIEKMTSSELLTLMTGGMATVAGSVLAAYVGLLHKFIPDIAGHLLTASVMSAPAAMLMAKIILPETEVPVTLGKVPEEAQSDSKPSNLIEAAADGASQGLSLALNVAAMLLAFIALIALVDAALKHLGIWIGFSNWGQSLVPDLILQAHPGHPPELSLSLILSWVFYPLAGVMGIPWKEAGVAAIFLGEKVALNEFIAYLHLSEVGGQLSEKTLIILSYALCGFANFSSIAIQIGGIGGLAPSRRSELAKLGIRSVIGGSLAAFMTATLAGLLL